ncbi:MAG: methylmalonyl-CoA mutase family protein [Thermodesulfobacteriota bacterium]|nr:methylmalonyl-CoA mutase family protein [Thermodesulfobacteriota bacterium]
MDEQVREIEKAYREAVTDFNTDSGIPVKEVYIPEDIAGIKFDEDIGLPGEYPFTRGHHPRMYRGKLWNMRQISGVSTPKRQNERLQFLLEQGANALNCEVDGTTWYGIEPDQPYAEGHFGVSGVALHTLRDVEAMVEGLPLDRLSMNWNDPLPGVAQAYLLAAKKRGHDFGDLRAVQSAIHFFLPVCVPSYTELLYVGKRFSTLARWGNDFCEYALKNLPKWNIWYCDSGSLVEAGANAVQEMAFAIASRNELVREMLRRGVDINTIGKKLSPTIALSRDFFEEIAKIRAARRVWARTMKEDFKATDPAAMCLRLHGNVTGSLYTRGQPLVNIVRGALGTLAGVLAGCMGIQVAFYDEAWCTPTEEAVTLAMRTQQVIRYESGVAKVADPLGGSYYVESLTNKMEEGITSLVEKIEQMGGWMATLQNGWVQDEVKKGFLDLQNKVESGNRMRVGLNCFVAPKEEDFQPQIYAPDSSDVDEYIAEFREFKKNRDEKRLKDAIESVRRVAEKTDENLVPYVFEALEADATFSEIIGVLRMVDGLDYDWAGEREYPF